MTHRTARALAPVATIAAIAAAAPAVGPDLCPTSSGPDVVVAELNGILKWGTIGDLTAYSVGTTSCNIGDADLDWDRDTNAHPVIGAALYRLHDGRFEQLGLSWLKHGFAALNEELCCACTLPDPITSQQLGVGCSDPYSANLNGDQDGNPLFGWGGLGPRSEVNPHTGAFPFPYTTVGEAGDVLYKRLQVRTADLDPEQHPGALYFAEAIYVSPDDAAAGNQNNNASWAPATVGDLANGGWVLSLGETVPMQPAIHAWAAHDPGVTLSESQVPGDGLLVLGFDATDNGDGTWHYEYALLNLNCHRAVRALSIPVPDGVTLADVGFHDVDHHSGEPYDGTDWPATRASGALTWATEPFALNENANALRWGTTYTFRFDADAPPAPADAIVTLFRPPAAAGDPPAVLVRTIGPADPCPADCAAPENDVVDVLDLLQVLTQWGGGATSCDVDGTGAVDVLDLLQVLSARGACPR